VKKVSVPLPKMTSGYHTLKIWIVDPAVVLERIVVSHGMLRPSYLGPPESFQGQAWVSEEVGRYRGGAIAAVAVHPAKHLSMKESSPLGGLAVVPQRLHYARGGRGAFRLARPLRGARPLGLEHHYTKEAELEANGAGPDRRPERHGLHASLSQPTAHRCLLAECRCALR